MGKLTGKVAIVTGGNRGIGKGTARALAREGAHVTLAARDIEALHQTASEIDGTTLVVPTDVSVEADVDNLFTQTMERFGKLDILFNNAGAFDGGPITELSTEEWDRVMGVNLRGPFLCTRAAFRIMKEQGGGRIINIGSISAQRPRMNTAPYSTSKFGLWGFTQATALEGREHGIVCSCLHPGNVNIERRAASTEQMDQEPMMSCEEIAETAVFMASQPPHVNILEAIMLPVEQLYLGRG